MITHQIIPNDYPELKLLCWHIDPSKPLSAKEVFGLYETNWRYIDKARLTDAEKTLIKELTCQFGKGVMNV